METMIGILGLFILAMIPWFIQLYRQKNTLLQEKQCLNEAISLLKATQQESSEQSVLLQERLRHISEETEQKTAELEAARLALQQSSTDLAGKEQALLMQGEALVKSEKILGETQQHNEQLRANDAKQQNMMTKLHTEHKQLQQSSQEKLALLEDAKGKMTQEFKLLANEIFEEKQQKMTVSSKQTLDAVLKPLQQEMYNFRQRIELVHKEDTEARSSLDRHLEHLKALNQQMSQDALNLTQALKSDSKVQGNWGEMILERLLESSGLREGFEFDREKTFKNDEGSFQRPDVIINMPGHKHVIIDAKVSLTHYERATSSADKHDKENMIKLHVKSLQKHIQTLADKRYDHIHEINSPDYVLMFVPIEGAYLMAVEADSSIFEAAFDKNIAVVTPSTLYATLKLVEQLWRYEQQSGNVAKLTKQAGSLHDKFAGFIKSFEEIDTHLGKAQKSYDTAMGKLKTGRGNLVTQVKTLATLSGKAKKELPAHLLEEAAVEDAVGHSEGDESN